MSSAVRQQNYPQTGIPAHFSKLYPETLLETVFLAAHPVGPSRIHGWFVPVETNSIVFLNNTGLATGSHVPGYKVPLANPLRRFYSPFAMVIPRGAPHGPTEGPVDVERGEAGAMIAVSAIPQHSQDHERRDEWSEEVREAQRKAGLE
eukprot:1647582-Rhodomonas_salina.1